MGYFYRMDGKVIWDGPERNRKATNTIIGTPVFSNEGDEPVLLPDVKFHCRVPDSVEDFDDQLSELITSCRAELEQHKNLSLITRTISAVVNNGVGGMLLPFGPVNSITSVHDVDNNEVASGSYLIQNGAMVSPYGVYTVVYTAGFTSCPPEIRRELLELIANRFENPGDTGKASVETISKTHNNKSFIA